jgi:hypothetical protein
MLQTHGWLSMGIEPSPKQARAQVAKAAQWLQNLWGKSLHPPEFTWAMLSMLPEWVFASPEQREQLALLTGSLFAAPALRTCLDAVPIERLRGLIGSKALDQVLSLSSQSSQSSQPINGPSWPTDPCSERSTLMGWGAALLAASLDAPALQLSVLRAFALPNQWHCIGLPPPMLAKRMTQLALEIFDVVGVADIHQDKL